MEAVYEVAKVTGVAGRSAMVTVPGSKSITNRALLLAAMAEGKSTLTGCLTSDDARYFLECLKTLGFPVEEEPDGALGSNITITGFGGKVPAGEAEVYVGSAGTASRFLAAMLAFAEGTYVMQSSDQMKKRPMGPLIASLREAGAQVVCLEEEGHFPLKITGTAGSAPKVLHVNIDQSSQFLSALLIAAGTLEENLRIAVSGSHGLAYVDMTAAMMGDFGVHVVKESSENTFCYQLVGADHYQSRDYAIEPDLSAAAYFYAMAAELGVTIGVRGVHGAMLQGDQAFLDLLVRMGCTRGEQEGSVTITGPGKLQGNLTADMSAFSDQALTLAAIAPYADGPIRITGIAHIRLQECDRIQAIVTNLQTLGIRVEAEDDAVTIYPGPLQGGDIQTFEDHRVAMSFALTGLLTEGVRILNPGCCSKTFAQFFDVLEDTVCHLQESRA